MGTSLCEVDKNGIPNIGCLRSKDRFDEIGILKKDQPDLYLAGRAKEEFKILTDLGVESQQDNISGRRFHELYLVKEAIDSEVGFEISVTVYEDGDYIIEYNTLPIDNVGNS